MLITNFFAKNAVLITSLFAKNAVLNTVLFARKRGAEHILLRGKNCNMVLSRSHVCENRLPFAEYLHLLYTTGPYVLRRAGHAGPGRRGTAGRTRETRGRARSTAGNKHGGRAGARGVHGRRAGGVRGGRAVGRARGRAEGHTGNARRWWRAQARTG